MVIRDEICAEVTFPHPSIGAKITSLSEFVSPSGTLAYVNAYAPSLSRREIENLDPCLFIPRGAG
jgi:hypothetical protein